MKYFLGILLITTVLSSCGSGSKSQDTNLNTPPPVAPIGTTNGTSNSLSLSDQNSTGVVISSAIGSPENGISNTPQNAPSSTSVTIQSNQAGGFAQ